MGRATRSRNRKLKFYRRVRTCIIAAAVIVALVLVWFGLIHRGGPLPDQVEGLEAKATYASMNLKWEPADKADGYCVYASDGGDMEKIAEIEGGDKCAYKFKDYIHTARKKRTCSGGAVCNGRDAALDKFAAHDDHDGSILTELLPDLPDQAQMSVVEWIIFSYDAGDVHGPSVKLFQFRHFCSGIVQK